MYVLRFFFKLNMKTKKGILHRIWILNFCNERCSSCDSLRHVLSFLFGKRRFFFISGLFYLDIRFF